MTRRSDARACSPSHTVRTCVLTVLLSLLVCASAFANLKEHAASRTSNLRLGTAAAPFGWAKAVADLDGDGTPDTAVADRGVTTRGGRTRYELEVKTSRGPSQVISFWSTERGLKLDITDIDADGDLDIVLLPLFRRTAAAVWLNDGAGRFEQQIFDGGNPPILPAGQLRRLRARMDPGSPLVSCLRTTIQVRTSTSVLVLPGMFVASVGSFDQPARNVFGGSFPALRAPPRP